MVCYTADMKLLTGSVLLWLCPIVLAQAEPKRIEVYTLSQHYWDVRAGESLSEIAAALLPHNPAIQQRLMRDILRLNPDAFISGDANRLLAGKRLFLPGSLTRADTVVDPQRYTVESYSWGNVKRPRSQ